MHVKLFLFLLQISSLYMPIQNREISTFLTQGNDKSAKDKAPTQPQEILHQLSLPKDIEKKIKQDPNALQTIMKDTGASSTVLSLIKQEDVQNPNESSMFKNLLKSFNLTNIMPDWKTFTWNRWFGPDQHCTSEPGPNGDTQVTEAGRAACAQKCASERELKEEMANENLARHARDGMKGVFVEDKDRKYYDCVRVGNKYECKCYFNDVCLVNNKVQQLINQVLTTRTKPRDMDFTELIETIFVFKFLPNPIGIIFAIFQCCD